MNNIETMKMALEALTKLNASPHLEDCEGAFDDEIAALRQAIEQAQQAEPVAWWNSTKDSVSTDPVHRHNKDCQPLYTTPPTRQPLTDKELNLIGAQWHYNLLGKDDKAELFAFARAIEAAHGIKGEA